MADDPGDSVPRLLIPGLTCWRHVPSRRFSVLVDTRQRIVIGGWDFDSTICLTPDSGEPTRFCTHKGIPLTVEM